MSKVINIKKGYNIQLIGQSEKDFGQKEIPQHFAIKPSCFHGVRPKLSINEGDTVKAGTPLFFDKDNDRVIFTSPVSGTVTEIVRGEKRVILEVKITADGKNEFENFKQADPKDLSRDEIIENLLKSGVWPMIRQRPFARIANPSDKPKAIYISAFDSSPLAADNNFIVEGQSEVFQKGIDVLKKLTDGKIHLNTHVDQEISSVFAKAKDVELHQFKGPHPAGNVGIQIHHINPIDKGDVVWYCYPQDVLSIGRLFHEGKYNAERVINLCGSQAIEKKYYKTIIGASIENIVKDNVEGDNNRFISGNVLTGTKISDTGYLGFYHSQLTVIPEGDYYEFIGWILPGFKKFSASKTIVSSWLSPKKKHNLDTNMHGGERAFVVSGEYEKVMPIDIYPVHLLKAIMAEDIDKMENLGIYEVAPEDFALCEVICTSKINSQTIVQQGIDLMVKELN
ncbi:MAG: Na(+)-translocating NADH-quinone reductase subunit A [Bacteroidetes bacterium]|nr:Na(+)-translocating NADH-quinone reductase subunit A [Bacteroidota bacterium]MBT3421538.1 Na(+)-translocating NADH-quinone reductase subunit A [Bacteroidota bacterium]MBT3800409.1 Na(+)-translocating NADH-quinone reductase subunit A [Bacteroidota bacterium]MBT4729049.1 Na(+)-translocating NADH-quinone reductase subunit A [Bacteroidota bacterium]MBT5991830.1 Na(+)-translocating NADH-quinone reductase subunit A [Bacteroidota bacterium]